MTILCSSGDTRETLALSVDSLPDRRLFRSEAAGLHLAGDRNKVCQSRDRFLPPSKFQVRCQYTLLAAHIKTTRGRPF